MNWMRDKMKIIIWLAVAAFGLTIFAGWGMGILGDHGRERQLGTIAGERVNMEEYLRELRTVQEEYEGSLTPEVRQQQRRRAFDRVVDRVLIRQLLREEGGSATPGEIRQWFTARPEFRDEEGGFDPQRYQSFLDMVGPARKRQLEQAEKDRIESFRFHSWLQSMVDVTDTELQHLLESGLREVQLYGVYADPTSYIDDELVRDYYLTHDDEFRAPPRAYLHQVFFEEPEGEGEQRRERLQEISRQVQLLQRRIETEEDFTQYARENSQDTETAPAGGLLGWVTRGELETPKARAIFRTEPGEISELVRGEDGYYVFYVGDLAVDEKKPLPEVREEIEAQLLSDSHWKMAREDIDASYERIGSEPAQALLREIAANHDGFAAQQRGEYGWVPVRFVYPRLERDAEVWFDELSDGFVIDPAISEILSGLRPGAMSEPLRSEYGYHIFYVNNERSGEIEELFQELREQLERYLLNEKLEGFIDKWLAWRREQVDIDLAVSPERVGRD